MSFKKKTIAVIMTVCMAVTLITAPTALAAESTGEAGFASSQDAQGNVDSDVQGTPEENNRENDSATSPENGSGQAVQPGTEETGNADADVQGEESQKPERYITVTKKIKKSVLVKAKANGRGGIVVKWSTISKSRGYRVYRATRKNGNYKRVYSTRNWRAHRWTDKSRKLRRNRTYYYKVLPKNRKALVQHKKIRVLASEKNTYKVSMASLSARADCNKARVTNKLRTKRSMRVRATAYSGGGLCANGKRVGVGRIAVDPRVTPLGTWVYVDGYGLAQACDTGGAIKGKRIDLYFNSEGQCERYGVRSTKLFVLR